jgi:hypothetical protein
MDDMRFRLLYGNISMIAFAFSALDGYQSDLFTQEKALSKGPLQLETQEQRYSYKLKEF